MVKISDAELQVMKIVWDSKEKEITSFQMIQGLKSTRWTDNTIRTLIRRLQDKGAIEIAKKEGKTFYYRAAIDEAEYRKEATRDFLEKLYGGSAKQFVLEAYQAGEIKAGEIESLFPLLEGKEKK